MLSSIDSIEAPAQDRPQLRRTEPERVFVVRGSRMGRPAWRRLSDKQRAGSGSTLPHPRRPQGAVKDERMSLAIPQTRELLYVFDSL